MKIEVSEYYKEKGVITVYVNVNKEPRRVATLKYENGELHSMSYAKYLYTSYYSCDVADGDEVDHINGNRMDDRIENLQVISRKLNKNKSKIRKTMIVTECPVCHKKFLFELRNLSAHTNPCCSRKCGGIKSHWKKN
jgi:hypothetical protein